MMEQILSDISAAEVAFAVALAALLVGYVAFILGPAWSSYGRLWERVAAAVLSVFILATLVGVGAALGFGVVYSYETWARP